MTFQLDEADIIQGFSVHPDGKRVLLTTGLQRDDIWLAEGFAQPATGWRRCSGIGVWERRTEDVASSRDASMRLYSKPVTAWRTLSPRR